MVSHCILFNDDDNTAIEAIRNVKMLYPNDRIIFANGGDRTLDNIPEMDSGVDNIEFVFGVGGEDKKILVAGYCKNGRLLRLNDNGDIIASCMKFRE